MGVELKARRQAKISNFKGVDFSSSPLLVAQNRAVNSKNFIYENGVNRKRNGWIEKYRIGTGNINGIFECVLNGIKTILVYSGTQFYKIVDGIITNITQSSSNESCKVKIDNLVDRRCQMFVSNNRCYFVGCGDYLTYGKYGDNFELRRVEDDEYTHIPTTTINIDADGVEGDIVETLESPNLLCRKRKNTFVGNDANSVFTVDAESIDEDVQVVVEHETLNDGGELVVKEYKSNGSTLYDGSTSVGSIDYSNGKITFSIDTKPFMVAESNLTITFGCKVKDYASRINKSEIGVMFGVNGNPDRLFVTGNEDFPNYDFYSEMNDLTYFGDLNSSIIGSSDSKIVGYSRLGDGTLATHKESVNGEASIYYRSGTFNTEYNADGSLSNVTAYFPIQAGTIGEGMVSKYANANLSGDKIYLSKNGVYGIVLSSNITSSERYSRERSQYIATKLKQHESLEDAVGIALDNKYYLAIDNVCYVADARITSQNTSDTDSYNYEWYFWDNMPVRVWGIVEGKLYFGTSDGRVCTFDDKYTDRIFEHTETNDLMLDYENNEVVYNSNLGVKENDIISFSTDVFKLKLDSSSILKVENGRIYLNEEDILTFYNDTEVYADNVGSSGLNTNKKYFIYDVNVADCSFVLRDENETIINILNDGFRLCENIKGIELLTTNIDEDSFKIKYTKDDTKNIVLVKYNDNESYQMPKANFTIKTNVCAFWYSPMFDFGTNQAMKTLLTLTISTEPTTNGQIDFGYTAKDSEASIQAQGINMFDFETLDFNNFTFDSSFANSYTVDIKDYFNFIQFFFQSDNEYACVIHSMTITYKINSTNKGVQ